MENMAMTVIFKKLRLSVTAMISTLIVASALTADPVKADDTEVFVSSGNTANVLLIFDLSGSMEWTTDECVDPQNNEAACFPGAGEKSRYEVLIESLTAVLNNLKTKSNLRIGLSIFGLSSLELNSAASGIRWPIRSISEDANLTDSMIANGTYQTHEIILKQLADYGTDGGTPIVDALFEALLYFKGDTVIKGAGPYEPPQWDGSSYKNSGIPLAAHPASYSPVTAWDSTTASFDSTATYLSPITNNCDNNYIILLSDGEPTLISMSTITNFESLSDSSCADPSGSQPWEGKCGPEIVSYLANTDLQSGNGIVPSNVITHTIGFAAGTDGDSYLQNLATLGGGNFYSASNAISLEQSLETILTKIASENESFTGLTTSIKSSTLSSDKRVFINMFKPSADRSWIGNTKGYFIDSVKGLVDINDNAAIDTATGQFKDTAQSFWSSGVDGNKVELGGLSGKLNPGTRSIYTYTGASPVPLNAALKKLATGDATIAAALFNAVDDTEKDVLIDWLYNAPMGDTLHANTIKLSYSGQDVLFTMTNQGLLHAFDVTSPTTTGDPSGGNELFAFIPQSLLPAIKDHMLQISASDHLYGLDGSITYWHDDTNNDRIVNGSEKVYLYFGMRRGGDQYFALDVTNPSLPKLVWRIDSGSAGFTTLGQTWSRPTLTTITLNGTADQKVIIFGGGYDVAQDGKTLRSADSVGNGVYIVNASTGALLWSTGSDASHTAVEAEMKYSIPSDLTVIDSDGDQQADRIYFGDMGGQIWRIDLPSSGSPDVFRLADFAVDAETLPANLRRFYMPPSVALIRNGGDLQYAVAIGSGYRAHPTTTDVDDRFYMIKDTNLNSDGNASTSWTLLTEADLYDTTSNLVGEGTTGAGGTKATAITALNNADGWYLKLTNSGEKSISPSLIFNNQLAFSTYTPANSGLTCGTTAGNGRLYLIDLKNATPIKDLIFDNNLKAEVQTCLESESQRLLFPTSHQEKAWSIFLSARKKSFLLTTPCSESTGR